MKRYLLINVLLTLLVTLAGTRTLAQGFVLSNIQASPGSVIECDSTASVSMSALNQGQSPADFNLTLMGSSFQASQFTVTVYWGDGNVTTHVGGTSASGVPISFSPPMNHYYSNTGNYTIFIHVNNPQNGSSAVDTLYYSKTICSAYLFSAV